MSGNQPERARAGFVTERPVAISMLMLSLVVFGLVSFFKLRVDLLPEISYPTLTVRTTWPGAAPEDIEERVSERIQEALSTLANLVRSSSVSRAGVSDVVLDFDWGTPMTFAVQEVRERLDSVFLPRGVERPLILRYDPNLDPILRIGVASSASERAAGDAELVRQRWIAENRLKREIEALPGVAAVQVRGGLEEEIRVRADPYKLNAHRIDPEMLAQRLAQENINASGGSLRDGSAEYLVRTLNEFRSPAEIEDLALAERGESVVRVRDVARVSRTHEKREVVTRIGGREAVELEIYREAGTNIVQVAQAVRDRVFGTQAQQARARKATEEGRADAPQTVGDRDQMPQLAWSLRRESKLELLSDQSTFIADAVEEVQSSAVTGALLAIVVLWLFLGRVAPTAIIAISIPMSVVVTFVPMFLSGVTLNIMSLGGLALGVGMLVDNAIVVLESIMRCRDEGDPPKVAALRGTREVLGAVIASTLTTVAVFAPIVFVSGVAGQLFGDQAMTVVTALSVSLLVSVLFIPMLASRRWLMGGPVEGDRVSGPERATEQPAARAPRAPAPRWRRASLRALSEVAALPGWTVRGLGYAWRATGVGLARFGGSGLFQRAYGAFENAYASALRAVLRAPLFVIALAALATLLAVWRVPKLGLELLPEIHQGEFTAHIALEMGTPLELTDEVMRALDERVRAIDGVLSTALVCGIEAETLTREIEGPHTARLTVRTAPEQRGHELEDSIAARVREIALNEPAVRTIDVRRPTPFALETPLQVEVRGQELDQLARTADEVRARLLELPSLTDVKTSVRAGHPEARITFDRDKTLEFGLDLTRVSNLVRDHVLGNVSTRFAEGEDRIDVRVVGDELVLTTLDSVLDLVVNPQSETPVPLRAVAEVNMQQGPAEIRRIGNTRAVLVEASSTGLDLGRSGEQIERALASLHLPEDVSVQVGGQKREMDEALGSMRFALALAVFLVYVVMAIQFESLLQPLIILLAVPLAGVGVVFTLDLLEVPLSVIVFIGLILLAGVVVNNAIVLIDRINQERAAGAELYAATLAAGRARLRPILMTTLTTVLGLLPMTGWLQAVPGLASIGWLQAGSGAEMRAPMAITVVSGLSISTLLTLIVIPCAYVLLERLLARARGAHVPRETLPPQAPVGAGT
jgi:HAE1 family hydrophobic/amphiphilic exporter-1